MNHVSDLRECEFFFVTRISRLGRAGEYEINFAMYKTRQKNHL